MNRRLSSILLVTILTYGSVFASSSLSFFVHQADSAQEIYLSMLNGGSLVIDGVTSDHWREAFSHFGVQFGEAGVGIFVRNMEVRSFPGGTKASFCRLVLQDGMLVLSKTNRVGGPWKRAFMEGEWVLYSNQFEVGVSSLTGEVFSLEGSSGEVPTREVERPTECPLVAMSRDISCEERRQTRSSRSPPKREEESTSWRHRESDTEIAINMPKMHRSRRHVESESAPAMPTLPRRAPQVVALRSSSAYKISITAVNSLGMRTSGRLGCADGASKVLQRAGYDIKHTRSTINLFRQIRESNSFVPVPLSELEPGDLIISPKGSRYGHVGFVVTDEEQRRKIVANSSKRGRMRFMGGQLENPEKWEKFEAKRGNDTYGFRSL